MTYLARHPWLLALAAIAAGLVAALASTLSAAAA
jgi:hypothetical protein